MEPQPPRPAAAARPWARAYRYARPHRRRAAAVLGLAFLSAAASAALPYAPKVVFDRAIAGRDAGTLAWIAGGILLAGWAAFALNALLARRAIAVSSDVLFDMRLDLFRQVFALGPRFAARTPLGEVVSRLNQDVGEVQRATADFAIGLASQGVLLASTAGFLLALSPGLFLLNLPLFPLAVFLHLRLRRRVEDSSRALRERSAGLGSFLVEALTGMRVVLAARAEDREGARFREKNRSFVDALLRAHSAAALGSGVPAALLALGGFATLLLGGSWVVAGTMTTGTFVAFFAFQARLFPLLASTLNLGLGLAGARPSLERMLEFLDRRREVVEKPGAKPLPSPRGALAFEGVVVDHGRGEPALRGLTFEAAAGETVALAGASGAGKSTAADLCLRFFDPDAGRIALDGIDLRDLRLEDLRAAVAVVSQETFLFHASIEENVRYARPEASAGEVRAAIEAAGLPEVLARFPQGLATPVGERGAALSGGERARVAIARAFLQRPALLVLDEPTAHLDGPAETKLLQALTGLMRGRTTLLVSHRASVVALADRVVLLEGGRAAFVGPPRTLARTAEAFRRLFPELAAVS